MIWILAETVIATVTANFYPKQDVMQFWYECKQFQECSSISYQFLFKYD